MLYFRKLYRNMLFPAMLIGALVLGACGDDTQTAPPPAPPAEEPAAPGAEVETEPVDVEPADTEPIDAELPHPSAIRATTLIGLNVEDANGENVGNVDDAFVIVANGEVQYAIISASGLEGAFADWMLPLPVDAVTIQSERNSLIVSGQAANLIDAPGFEQETWPDLTDEDWDVDVRSFWADFVGTDEADEEMDEADATPTPAAEEEPAEEEAAEDEATEDADTEEGDTEEGDTEEGDTEADATPTPAAEEEPAEEEAAEDEATEDADTEEGDTEEGDTEAADALATVIPEEEDMAEEDMDEAGEGEEGDTEEGDTEADATPTPAAEEEPADEGADTEEADTEAADAEATAMPEEEDMDETDTADAEAQEEDGDLVVRVPYAMSLEELLDFEVHDANGESLGDVEDFVLDWDEGRIQYVVLSFGGFLGLGERRFAFPWGELVFDPLENAFVTTVTEEALSDAPGFDPDNWPDLDDPAWDDQFFDYWGNQGEEVQ